MLMHSANVEEVFSEDHVIKRKIRQFVRGDEDADKRLDQEVRAKLKHVTGVEVR